MNTNYKQRTMTSTDNYRSIFVWGNNMQVVRKGNGDIAMTETELVDFFGVTWKKLNYHLQLLLKTSHLHPDERDAGEEEVFVNGQPRDYAPLYPLSIIIALSYQLDSMEAYLFRKYICREICRPANIITPIFLTDKTDS